MKEKYGFCCLSKASFLCHIPLTILNSAASVVTFLEIDTVLQEPICEELRQSYRRSMQD